MRAITAARAVVLAAAASLGLSSAEDVSVDLTPCIFSNGTVKMDEELVSEAYLLGEFFKGFWGSTQIEVDANRTTNPSFDLDDVLSDGKLHGYCNVVFVGFKPTADEYASLKLYSQNFKVRIVYMMVTAGDVGVLAKLGCGTQYRMPFNNEKNLEESYIEGVRLIDENSRLVKPFLETSPKKNNVYVTPMVVLTEPPEEGAEVTVVAEYIDDKADTMMYTEMLPAGGDTMVSVDYPSAAAVTYTGAGGEEEMHVFFHLAWFDLGSWAWAHYITEWATKGIFQGERRFWLGAQVDDLFLDTTVFEWDGDKNEGEYPVKERVSYDDLHALLDGTEELNAEYNSNITTEFPFNGLGILEKVGSAHLYSFDDADAALLPKGDPPRENADGTLGFDSLVTPENWWSAERRDGLREAFGIEGEDWKENDELLRASLELVDKFHWQSHTMSHLARDNLGETDCFMEDNANAWLAVITGMYEAETYNSRSMTNPGITGLFNKNCLKSAMDNLITCAPGDNTYVGSEEVPIRLISDVSQFHSIYTTEETNGLDGFQIVPRFATYVYYNCRTMKCLVEENLYIRRSVCKCEDTNPLKDDGTLNDEMAGCDMNACPTPGVDDNPGPEDFLAFMTPENLFATEAETTVRYLLSGRRDMYMFHQANVVPTATFLEGEEDMSLLELWYRVVLEELSEYINIKGPAESSFGVKSVKFDDLCTDFKHHENLDFSASVVTVTKSSDGAIIDMALSHSGTVDATVVPVTVPKSEASKMQTNEWTMKVLDTESYGSDSTFYASTTGEAPVIPKQPTSDDLPEPPTVSDDGSGDSSSSDDSSDDSSCDDSSDDHRHEKHHHNHDKKHHHNHDNKHNKHNKRGRGSH